MYRLKSIIIHRSTDVSRVVVQCPELVILKNLHPAIELFLPRAKGIKL